MALELSIHEFSLIVAAVSPFKFAFSLLFALVELSSVAGPGSLVPRLLPLSVLRIIDPLPPVSHTLSGIVECAFACSFIGDPLTHVNISVGLCHLAPAVEEALAELTFVASPVRI